MTLITLCLGLFIICAFAIISTWAFSCLRLIYWFVDQGLMRGTRSFFVISAWIVMRGFRITVWSVQNILKLVLFLWPIIRRFGVWCARFTHAQLYVLSFRLCEWYIANELKKRKQQY